MTKLKLFLIVFSVFAALTASAQEITVSGTVTSAESGEKLFGAYVLVGTNGTATDDEGYYSVSAKVGERIVFQYIGCTSVEFVVPAGNPEIVHDVELKLDNTLDDVVVVAYGVRKKGTIAGSVSTVKSDALADVPAASFDQALQGKATGLMVLSNSGEPSATATFQIRGTNSINAGTAPLFILDGLPISSGDFNAISPNDIQSISVLKDATSTSIYGARAANGVVVITTKKGKASERAQIQLRAQLGISQLAHGNWNLMNTEERIQYEKEVGLTAGKDYAKLALTDVNWLNEVFNSFAPLQSYDLQVSGANERTSYFVSGGWYDQQGTTSDSNFSRSNFRSNFETKATNWLKIGTNTMFAFEDYAETMSGEYALNTPIAASRFMLPYWNPYRADGTIASINDGSWKGQGQNPLEWAKTNPYITKKYKLISGLFLEINPIEGLTFKSQAGVDFTHGTVKTTVLPSYKPNNGQGSAARSSSDGTNLTIFNTLNYAFDVNEHKMNFMLGQEGILYKAEGFSVSTAGQANDYILDISSATRATSWNSSTSSYSYLSFFGRGEYNWNNRWFLEGAIRADGSSKFGKSGRWAPFGSLGLMWDAKNEDFLKSNRWLTFAQVSLGTGTAGNSSIPNYDHIALVSGGRDYFGNAGISPSTKGNENLKWEKTWSSNASIHLGFFNAVDFQVDFYNKLTTNMLMSVPVSYADGGFGYRWDNVGGMVNRGVELDLSINVLNTKDFSWNINANASYNKNKITELYNGLNEYVVSTTGTKLVVGHSYGEFFLNRFAGVNPINGDPLWYTADGEITDEFRESDKVMTGKSYIAPWQGGFGTTFSWKGLSFSAQFSWVADRWMINNDRYFEEGGGLFDAYNQSKRMLYDRWKKPGDITDIPRHGVSPQFDTHLLEDASFLRLKNLMLAYSLPKGLLEKSRFFTGARAYLQAQNLLTFTPFTGLDPESSSNVYKAQYPMSRQFTLGIDLTF